MAKTGETISRNSLLESDGFTGIREALNHASDGYQTQGKTWDFWKPIRETPLAVFFDKSDGSMDDMRLNPNLPRIWHERYGVSIGDYAARGGNAVRETVSVPNTLSILKIADEIIEGAEPYSDWKQYSRLIEMDAPKVNVPKTRYTDQLGGGLGTAFNLNIFKESGGKPPMIGGKMEPIELDCSNTKNSFRGTIRVERNDVKDNNFLAVEQPLKNAGNLFYYLAGKRIIDQMITDTTVNTDTRANLDLATPIQSEFEALANVIRSQFRGTQRNTADTMFINPADAFETIATSTGASGSYLFLDKRVLRDDNNSDVVNNSGLAAALGLKNVYETPQIAADTVMITKRDVAQCVGLREDLTIENYDMTVGGLYDSDLVLRFDVKEADENGAYKITGFSI
jgi:hypothetical protein